MRIALALLTVGTQIAIALSPGLVCAETIEVIGKGGPNRWEDQQGHASPSRAMVGNPDRRLQIRVRNGDIVHFRVDGGRHGVIFEKAQSEIAAGVWKVVEGSGELSELASDFRNFDRADARLERHQPNQDRDPESPGRKQHSVRLQPAFEGRQCDDSGGNAGHDCAP